MLILWNVFLQTPLSQIYWICEASIFAGGERSGMMEGLTTLNSHIKNTGVHIRFKPLFYICRFFQDAGHLSGDFKNVLILIAVVYNSFNRWNTHSKKSAIRPRLDYSYQQCQDYRYYQQYVNLYQNYFYEHVLLIFAILSLIFLLLVLLFFLLLVYFSDFQYSFVCSSTSQVSMLVLLQ